MKIEIVTRSGDIVTRQVRVGQKLVGLRIRSVTFEHPDELKAAFANPDWMARQLVHIFRPAILDQGRAAGFSSAL